MVLMTKIYVTTPTTQEIQKKIHRFTNPICTNPQIHPNKHKCTDICTNTRNQEEIGPMLLMIQNYGTTPMTQIIQNKSTNSQIRFVQIHKYTKNKHKYNQIFNKMLFKA
jgi:hypothetical protein